MWDETDIFKLQEGREKVQGEKKKNYNNEK